MIPTVSFCCGNTPKLEKISSIQQLGQILILHGLIQYNTEKPKHSGLFVQLNRPWMLSNHRLITLLAHFQSLISQYIAFCRMIKPLTIRFSPLTSLSFSSEGYRDPLKVLGTCYPVLLAEHTVCKDFINVFLKNFSAYC